MELSGKIKQDIKHLSNDKVTINIFLIKNRIGCCSEFELTIYSYEIVEYFVKEFKLLPEYFFISTEDYNLLEKSDRLRFLRINSLKIGHSLICKTTIFPEFFPKGISYRYLLCDGNFLSGVSKNAIYFDLI